MSFYREGGAVLISDRDVDGVFSSAILRNRDFAPIGAADVLE